MESFENTVLHSVKVIIEIDKVIDDYFSKYQHIEVLQTKGMGRILVIDNELQFSELDEFIYHEMFSMPALLSHDNPRNIMIMGGGDLLLAKQLLKLPSVESIDLLIKLRGR